ncbi:MAG: hypothetical protein IJE82_03385 [Alphaproteobacteria bacterium]|nr:hypothetical protein [Alphaproteobacteria bacterium]
MKKLFIVFGIVCATSAFADEVQVVAERLSCADISARISEIGAIAEPTEEQVAELTTLKADYRRMCTKSARGRRTSADARVIVESAPVDDVDEDVDEDVVVADEQPVQEEVPLEKVEDVVAIDPMVALEAELANLDAGLCADGSQPNKFGCCGDEVFKDLGDTVFACCPRDGGNSDCFPPLK